MESSSSVKIANLHVSHHVRLWYQSFLCFKSSLWFQEHLFHGLISYHFTTTAYSYLIIPETERKHFWKLCSVDTEQRHSAFRPVFTDITMIPCLITSESRNSRSREVLGSSVMTYVGYFGRLRYSHALSTGRQVKFVLTTVEELIGCCFMWA